MSVNVRYRANGNSHPEAVEKAIATTKAKLKDPKLAWMFENCFPNTLDTTCEHKMVNGKPDTFVLTGDIHAMWLRDSSAQVFPHIQFANDDPKVKTMLAGVITARPGVSTSTRMLTASTKDRPAVNGKATLLI